jgi:ABC-type Na+ efflux pump permease subunit
MALSDHLSLRAVNDMVHDLSAGVVPAQALALWLVRQGAQAVLAPDAFATLVRGWTWAVLVIVVAMVLLFITGTIRLGYRTRNTREDAVAIQGRTALIKHGVMVALFLGGVVLAFMAIQP